MVSFRSYVVAGIAEEGSCENCGSEMWCQEGDTNWEVLDSHGEAIEAGFCSKKCARDWHKEA